MRISTSQIESYLIRYQNRQVIVDKENEDGIYIIGMDDGGPKKRIPRGNYHQLDKLVVQVEETDQLQATADVMGRMLKRMHNDELDFRLLFPSNY